MSVNRVFNINYVQPEQRNRKKLQHWKICAMPPNFIYEPNCFCNIFHGFVDLCSGGFSCIISLLWQTGANDSIRKMQNYENVLQRSYWFAEFYYYYYWVFFVQLLSCELSLGAVFFFILKFKDFQNLVDLEK